MEGRFVRKVYLEQGGATVSLPALASILFTGGELLVEEKTWGKCS